MSKRSTITLLALAHNHCGARSVSGHRLSSAKAPELAPLKVCAGASQRQSVVRPWCAAPRHPKTKPVFSSVSSRETGPFSVSETGFEPAESVIGFGRNHRSASPEYARCRLANNIRSKRKHTGPRFSKNQQGRKGDAAARHG